MITAAEVFLWGTRIGVISQGPNEPAASFEYDSKFLTSGIELSPIKMPLNQKIYRFPELSSVSSFHGLAGLFADSLPDKFGNAVIEKWLAIQGRTIDSFTPIERLCYTGKRGMGALEYVPATFSKTHTDDVDVNAMTKLASEILTNKQSRYLSADAFDVARLLDIGSSAGGARAKAVIAWNKATDTIKSGQIDAGEGFEHYLIKFDSVSGNGDHGLIDSKQYTLIEYAYHLMAKDVGIIMEECRIYTKDGLNHFITKRFDRKGNEKLHMQTFGALAHLDYNVPCLSSYEMCAEYAKRLGADIEQIEQLYTRMVFNIASMNHDDHVKNISFLMDRNGMWRLSPAYDLTFAYKPDNIWLSQHQMTVNGKSKDISFNDLIACGKSFGLPVRRCKDIIESATKVISNWMNYAEECGINEQRASLLDGQLAKNIKHCIMSKAHYPEI